MGDFPEFTKNSLAFEKCLQPKNPRWADSGEGCTACRTWCRFLSIAAPFFWAYEPHNMNTRPSRFLLSHCTTASVKVSQPLSLWELAWCARTVNTALSNSTPCLAHPVRSPCLGCVKPSISDVSSLYMFSKLGGGGTGLFTLKHNPWAWFGPW